MFYNNEKKRLCMHEFQWLKRTPGKEKSFIVFLLLKSRLLTQYIMHRFLRILNILPVIVFPTPSIKLVKVAVLLFCNISVWEPGFGRVTWGRVTQVLAQRATDVKTIDLLLCARGSRYKPRPATPTLTCGPPN